jgi:hypothetical protein
VRLHSDEHGVELLQDFGVVEFQHPSSLRRVVHVENPEVHG